MWFQYTCFFRALLLLDERLISESGAIDNYFGIKE
jgi:hypothetical protein